MPRFRYNGEQARPGLVASQGPCSEIRVPCKDGSRLVIRPHGPGSDFAVGADVGVDVTDPRALRALRADPRFSELPAP